MPRYRHRYRLRLHWPKNRGLNYWASEAQGTAVSALHRVNISVGQSFRILVGRRRRFPRDTLFNRSVADRPTNFGTLPQRPLRSVSMPPLPGRRVPTRVIVLQYVRPDVNNASSDHSESARCTCAKIKHATAPERAAIVYCNDDASASLRISYANASPER